jgi:hypothetical protein
LLNLLEQVQETTDAWLKIAIDVLNDDSDGADFIKTSDDHFLQPDPNVEIRHADIK